MAKCMTKSCTASKAELAQYHGLCLKCYSQAKKLVDTGATTWQWLENNGMVEATKSEFEQAFEAAKKGTLPEGP